MLVDEVVAPLVRSPAFSVAPFYKTGILYKESGSRPTTLQEVVTHCMLAPVSLHGCIDIMAVLEMDIQQVLGRKVFVAFGTPVRVCLTIVSFVVPVCRERHHLSMWRERASHCNVRAGIDGGLVEFCDLGGGLWYSFQSKVIRKADTVLGVFFFRLA